VFVSFGLAMARGPNLIAVIWVEHKTSEMRVTGLLCC